MLLLITGSRKMTKRGLEYARAAVRRAKECGHEIIVGDAEGIDAEVMNECHKLGVQCTVTGAYNKLRRRTPTCSTKVITGNYTERDRYMVKRADACLAIWNGKSRGTKYTYDYAVESGKKAWLKAFAPANQGTQKPGTQPNSGANTTFGEQLTGYNKFLYGLLDDAGKAAFEAGWAHAGRESSNLVTGYKIEDGVFAGLIEEEAGDTIPGLTSAPPKVGKLHIADSLDTPEFEIFYIQCACGRNFEHRATLPMVRCRCGATAKLEALITAFKERFPRYRTLAERGF